MYFLQTSYLVCTLSPRSFYLSRNQNKKHLILWEVVKARCLFQDHCAGSQAVWFCLKESWNLFTSLWLHKHRQPISNSTQLRSDQWNHQLGFLTKFGHEVITGIDTRCKNCVLNAFSLMKSGGKQTPKTEWMKSRAGEITELSGKCWV